MYHTDEILLDAIACQARRAYAASQLDTCQAALRLWQQRADHWSDEYSNARIQYELAYYTQQVMRWQCYLTELAPVPQIVPTSM